MENSAHGKIYIEILLSLVRFKAFAFRREDLMYKFVSLCLESFKEGIDLLVCLSHRFFSENFSEEHNFLEKLLLIQILREKELKSSNMRFATQQPLVAVWSKPNSF